MYTVAWDGTDFCTKAYRTGGVFACVMGPSILLIVFIVSTNLQLRVIRLIDHRLRGIWRRNFVLFLFLYSFPEHGVRSAV